MVKKKNPLIPQNHTPYKRETYFNSELYIVVKETQQIHSHSLEEDSSDGQRHEQHWRWFLWQGTKTPLRKVLDLCVHSWPEEVVLDFLSSISCCQVATQGMGVSYGRCMITLILESGTTSRLVGWQQCLVARSNTGACRGCGKRTQGVAALSLHLQ